MSGNFFAEDSDVVTDDEVLTALEKVAVSETFEGSDRLKDLLSYVVRKHLGAPGAPILGKQIAEDVYGRRAAGDGGTGNVVRVDASRLRRRLDAYYLDEGSADAVRIHIDKGGYVPRFSKAVTQADLVAKDTSEERSTPTGRSFVPLIAVGAIAGFLAGLAAAIALFDDGPAIAAIATSPAQSTEDAVRGTLFETAPEALQAVNLARQGRTMLFPATEHNRLRAAMVLFEEAIERSPTYFGGHAGMAQAAAMFGGLAPEGENRDAMLASARHHAEEALRLGPSEAWSQSALAFLHMIERDFSDATRVSARAVALSPDDPLVLEMDAIIAFFSGDFERALMNSAPEKHVGRIGRGAWQNVYGNASFYVGQYERSIDTLYEAAASGSAISQINTAHLIASLQQAGRTEEAGRLLNEYTEAWPESRIEELMVGLFQDPANAAMLIEQLEAAGWRGG